MAVERPSYERYLDYVVGGVDCEMRDNLLRGWSAAIQSQGELIAPNDSTDSNGSTDSNESSDSGRSRSASSRMRDFKRLSVGSTGVKILNRQSTVYCLLGSRAETMGPCPFMRAPYSVYGDVVVEQGRGKFGLLKLRLFLERALGGTRLGRTFVRARGSGRARSR